LEKIRIQVKKEGKIELNSIIKRFFKNFGQEKVFQQFIESIIIEGMD